jgi:colanic acid biosynthesis glycosyl transferase WcaI
MKRPLRIFLYGMNYAPEPTGAGRYSGELGAFLAKQGVDVEVVTTAPHYPGWLIRAPYHRFAYQSETLDGVKITRCPMITRKEMQGAWRILAPVSFAILSAPVALWRIVRSRPDTVLVIEPTLLVAPAALLGAWLVGARTVLHVQDLEIDAAFAVGHIKGNWLLRFARACERVILSGFDRVVTISHEMQSRICSKGVPQDRLAVIRNWVDIKKIVPLHSPNGYRKELGLTEESFVALYAGNIGAKQALHVVFDAAVRLEGESNIVFVIAGDGPEKARLQERYSHLRNVRFLPLQPEARLCELVNLADLHLLPQDRNVAALVLPSKLGGMLASGRDILVATDPGTELYRFLLGTAIIVPSGDSERMAEEIANRARAGTKPPMAPHPQVAMLDAETNLPEFVALLSANTRAA